MHMTTSKQTSERFIKKLGRDDLFCTSECGKAASIFWLCANCSKPEETNEGREPRKPCNRFIPNRVPVCQKPSIGQNEVPVPVLNLSLSPSFTRRKKIVKPLKFLCHHTLQPTKTVTIFHSLQSHFSPWRNSIEFHPHSAAPR
jgi:hypothetical protein